jgi:hypothetical protein
MTTPRCTRLVLTTCPNVAVNDERPLRCSDHKAPAGVKDRDWPPVAGSLEASVFEMLAEMAGGESEVDGTYGITLVAPLALLLQAKLDERTAALRSKLEAVTEAAGAALECIDTRTHDGIFWGARADVKGRLADALKDAKTTPS